jgi:hypothetical protein
LNLAAGRIRRLGVLHHCSVFCIIRDRCDTFFAATGSGAKSKLVLQIIHAQTNRRSRSFSSNTTSSTQLAEV